MPVEIKELIIRVVVGNQDSASTPQSGKLDIELSDREAIVQECVQQVLRILKKEEER
jgi:hypothetical protein